MSGRAIRGRLEEERGVTLTEMLVVLLILGIVLAGMTTLFVSAGTSQIEQTNRVEGQRNARLALDSLRREIRCASAVTTPIAVSSITITLPGYCQKPPVAGSAPFTWCAVGASQPYALWRYAGTACSGTGVRKADSLVSNAIFTYNRNVAGPLQLTPLPGASVADGYFKPGIPYSYAVTAVTSAGEISGSVAQVTFATGSPNQITVRWNMYAGALSYNVYGRDDGSTTVEGLRKLNTAPISAGATSYVDLGCATPADGCSSAVVVSSALAAPPLATISFSLAFDVTTADGRQRFNLSDDVVLRNSGRR